jgi:hypothetical protein
MIRISLRFFANRVLRTGRMDEGDRRTLERVIFSDGVRSRVEVEILLQLARSITTKDHAWTDFVVASVVDFVVWGARPTGYVDADTARWMAAVLAEGGRTRLSRRIAREIVKEAQHVDAALVEFTRPWWWPRQAWLNWRSPLEQRTWAPA